ncbi:MAG: TenA family protein [Alistipes putredinis]
MKKWSEEAWDVARPTYLKIIEHPFVEELARGTLAADKFLFYLRQDSLYLAHYSRVLTHIASRLTEKEHIAAFIRFASDGIEVEEALHWLLSERRRTGSRRDQPDMPALHLGTASPGHSPGRSGSRCRASLLLGLSAGRAADHRPAAGSGNPYAQWIETYADPSFTEATSQAIGICDALAEKTGPETRRRMTDIFLRCTKMEWLFWDSAWYLESWKI